MSGEKQKKPLFKKPVFWIVVVIAVFIIAGAAGSGSGKQSVQVTPETSASDTQAAASPDTQAADTAAPAESAAAATEAPAGTEAAGSDNAIAMNTPVEIEDGMTLTVLSAGPYDTGNEFMQPADGNIYYAVQMELANNGSSDTTVSSLLGFSAYADDYAVDQAYVNDDMLDGTVAAGKKIKGSLVYEIPSTTKTLQIDYKSNFWTGKTFTMTFQVQ